MRAIAWICFGVGIFIYVFGLSIQSALLSTSHQLGTLIIFFLTSLAVHAFSAPFLFAGFLFRRCQRPEQFVLRLNTLIGALGRTAANSERHDRSDPENSLPPRRIRIFLASSAELVEDRDSFELNVRRLNDRWIGSGVYFELVRWERFLDAMSSTGLQAEYNKEITRCDAFVALFASKAGQYTQQEFQSAWQSFKNTGKPLIYTYFKNISVGLLDLNGEDFDSLRSFRAELNRLQHFETRYANTSELHGHFNGQIDRLFG